MEIWQIWVIVGIIFLILEMLTPVLFMASLGLGCFGAAVFAFLGLGMTLQISIFTFISIVFIVLIRPFIRKSLIEKNSSTTGLSRYIGRTAKVIEKIKNTEEKGRVRIFDEEWVARSVNGKEIELNETVIIMKNEGLILYVEKLEGDN